MEQKLDRQAQHRLAVLRHVEEVTGNVARTCRYYGISGPTYYKWLRRYQDEGLTGLRDRSSAPHHCPTATHADIVNKIVYLRQNYHFGPVKIQMYLKRYHDITITSSAIYNILVRHTRNRQGADLWPAAQAATPRQVLPVHRNRRLHPATRAAHLPALRPEDRRPVPGLRPAASALSRRSHPDRQRRRVPDRVPLARARPGHRAHLHQTRIAAPQRQGRAFPPHRRRRVLPHARRCRHR
ncbi:helix-turn-helix domain containing protein [Actinoplanes sp. LDG1-01]|uniref:Helix-turn-helix domain containing protein n=1 Tax=Paractinoplanes lichenicola TaxID=2802976 RepID=A0ABS1VJP7_9ACTN|nr:helix-turn-helix domain containing protein [Actinoplanes lichenicola]